MPDAAAGGGSGRVWLDVPYGEKDQAKMAGARWDPTARRWYAPTPAAAARLSRWAALPDLPVVLAGEDRNFGAGLFVDLVPSSCWFTNVRSCVSQRDWERIRRMVTTRAQRRCEACHSPEDRALARWLDVHERWSYDDTLGVQTLRRLICLCSHCHVVTHFGLAEVRGQATEAVEHLVAVTGMSRAQAGEHVDAAFRVWRSRSRRAWTLDLSVLTTAGVAVTPLPDQAERASVAEATVRRVRAAERGGW